MLPVALNCTDGLRFLGAAWAPRVEGSGGCILALALYAGNRPRSTSY